MHLAIKEINRKTDNTVFVKNKDGIITKKKEKKFQNTLPKPFKKTTL